MKKTCFLITLILTLLFAFDVVALSACNASEAFPDNTMSQQQLQRFLQAASLIQKNYVKPVSDKQLVDNAIQGMLQGLDPHSDYLSAKEFSDLKDNTQGWFGGIGLEIEKTKGNIQVVTPLDDTPAKKAGLEPGDIIVKVNRSATQDMSLLKVAQLLRGKPGSQVDLTIYRPQEQDFLKFTLVREVINVNSVTTRMLTTYIGYVRISQFQENTAQDLKKAVLQLQAKNKLQGVVVDLRNNPGGLLDSAISVVDLFLQPGSQNKNNIIVYTKGRRSDKDSIALTTDKVIIPHIPMVVLINQGSASAAEIVAGALQDHHRAIIMGTPSFGKGSVQTVLPLADKSAIKLTTALYYTPSGRSIQAKGIQPDVVVPELHWQTKNLLNETPSLTEKDLALHLTQQATSKSKKTRKSSADLLLQDYQLNEAVNVLTALKAANLQK